MEQAAGNIRLMPTNAIPPGTDRPIVLLMSGGVDSSTSAHILKDSGYSVIGITMQVRQTADEQPARAICDAAEVCNHLGLPHYMVDLSAAFEGIVVGKFRRSYAAGQTPNPCVDCNMHIKFGLLWQLAREQLGITNIATGHYARIVRDGDEYRLATAADKTKDQSYFLSGIAKDRLADIVFPLGDSRKTDIREMARDIGLHVAQKAESMELCFAGEGDYRAMLGLEHSSNKGDLLDMSGRKIGTHEGVANYTIGQRRGLKFAGGQPLYVGRIDPVMNTVAIGTRDEVHRHIVTAQGINTLIPQELLAGLRAMGKVRSYGQGRACTIETVTPDGFSVRFDEGEFAPCPGQRLVVYDEKECVIAGGTIVSSDQ
jgi:tRNA-uridine 2-sulfurtransferase